MDLANLKNIDVNDLFNKLKSGGFGDKKILIKLLSYKLLFSTAAKS